MTRARAALAPALLLLAPLVPLLAAGCGGPARSAPRYEALHLRPATDLLPAAALVWLADVRLAELASRADLAPALGVIAPPDKLAAFARSHGGLDLAQLDEGVVASYPGETVVVAVGPTDPVGLEKAFRDRALEVSGRSVDGAKTEGGLERTPITRLWGSGWGTSLATSAGAGERRQLALFGRDGFAYESGRFAVVRAVEAFAQGRLKKAVPALQGAALRRLALVLPDAPVRVFAPGPFAGEWARAMGGLLAGSTAAGIALEVVPGPAAPSSARLRLTLALLDARNDEPDKAVARLSVAFDVFASSDLGRLAGIDKPLAPPRAWYKDDALELQVELDAIALTRGIHAALDARADELMGY